LAAPVLTDNEKKVLGYIKDYEKKGYSDEKIKAVLASSGISEETITKCMNLAHAKVPIYKKRNFWIAVGAGVIVLVVLLLLLLPGKECERDRDCDSGFDCVDNACVEEVRIPIEEEEVLPGVEIEIPECLIDSDCAEDFVCENDVCVEEEKGIEPQCGDGNCDIGEGSCVLDCGCVNDDDCETYGNYYCDSSNTCSYGGGSGGGGSSSGGTSSTESTPAASCTSDTACTDGYACDVSSGDCYTSCIANDACASGYACADSGACSVDTDGDGVADEDECVRDADCAAGYRCYAETQTCFSSCETNDQCTADAACSVDGECVVEEAQCTDSDGGFDSAVYGTTEGLINLASAQKIMYSDECIDARTVKEYYCDDDLLAYEEEECAGSCVEGVCGEEEAVVTGCVDENCGAYVCDASTDACYDSCTDDSLCADGNACGESGECSEDADNDGIADADEVECNDAEDNDGDGATDVADSDCTSTDDLSEGPCDYLSSTVETIDENALTFNSLALDASGNPAIAYWYSDGTGNYLKLSYSDGTSWTSSVAEGVSDSSAGYLPSVAVDSEGNVHVAYYVVESDDLNYAVYDGTSWSIETVASTGDVGAFPSLALDSNGNAQIVYADNTNDALMRASFDGSSWTTDVIASSAGASFQGLLALDANDDPHVVYYDTVSQILQYAVFDVSWSSETVTGAATTILHFALDLDAAGNPHVAYRDNDGLPQYASRSDSGWSTELVSSTALEFYPSLALDSHDYAHISYEELLTSYPTLASFDGSGWSTSVLENERITVSSIATDVDDNIHVSYALNEGPLHYAKVYCRVGSVTEDCSNGRDDDGDGDADQSDSDCAAEAVGIMCIEELPGCADGVDNDADGAVDIDDPSCLGSWEGEESYVECASDADCTLVEYCSSEFTCEDITPCSYTFQLNEGFTYQDIEMLFTGVSTDFRGDLYSELTVNTAYQILRQASATDVYVLNNVVLSGYTGDTEFGYSVTTIDETTPAIDMAVYVPDCSAITAAPTAEAVAPAVVACNDGADNDGDGKWDYYGACAGALGRVVKTCSALVTPADYSSAAEVRSACEAACEANVGINLGSRYVDADTGCSSESDTSEATFVFGGVDLGVAGGGPAPNLRIVDTGLIRFTPDLSGEKYRFPFLDLVIDTSGWRDEYGVIIWETPDRSLVDPIVDDYVIKENPTVGELIQWMYTVQRYSVQETAEQLTYLGLSPFVTTEIIYSAFAGSTIDYQTQLLQAFSVTGANANGLALIMVQLGMSESQRTSFLQNLGFTVDEISAANTFAVQDIGINILRDQLDSYAFTSLVSLDSRLSTATRITQKLTTTQVRLAPQQDNALQRFWAFVFGTY